MNKKSVLIFSTADQNNFPYAVKMFNSLTKFHSPRDIDMVLYTNETRPEELARLPKGIKIEDISPYLADDAMFWYRQKPILAEKYMDEYDLVLGLDCDQIICGKLDYIFETRGYDCGVVINWNRADPQIYGLVDIARIGIAPVEYYNCGLVAMRSKKFVHHWRVLCFAPEFNYMQYKEQDILNILCHFGNYNIRCFDIPDGVAKYAAWHGLIDKGELTRAQLSQNGDIIVPKGEGTTPFPPDHMIIKVIHFAGGQGGGDKFNYKTMVNEEVGKRLDQLIT